MITIKTPLLLVLFLFIGTTYSQTKIVTGKVTDSLNNPLDNATVITSALMDKADFKFTTSNDKGEFLLELKEKVTYKIEISYIGFMDYAIEIIPEKQNAPLLIKLAPSIEQLDNIVINYKVEPMIIKKDTVVFDVSKFTDGNERKLKDQLKKLPGIEVSKKGVVTYQGKEVKTTLVESGSFFGGGSKIAVENIPADAVDRIVLLDNFSEVDFMKPVSESGELVMNVKLKKDKKKFIFGDVSAGHSYDKYYKFHSNLFYYSPKRNLSTIGDLNNNGSNTLEFEDIFRLESGKYSMYAKNNRNADNDLLQFAINNDRVVKTNAKFVALNYNDKLTTKTKLETYFLYSYNKNFKSNNSVIQYVNNSSINEEDRTTSNQQKIDFALLNLKLNSRLNDKVNLKYAVSLKKSNGTINNDVVSLSNTTTNFFDINNANENKSIHHFIEFNRQKSVKKYQTFVISHNYNESVADKNWLSNTIFLQNIFPLQNDTFYNIVKDAYVKTNSFDATYSSYWVPNNKNIITLSAVGELLFQDYTEIDRQLLSDNSYVNFDTNLFGKKLKNQDNRVALDIEYKLILKKWTNIFGIEVENIQRKFENFKNQETIHKVNLNPSFKSIYKFSEAHVLDFTYEYSNKITPIEKSATGLTINSLNSVILGNSDLRFEKKHFFALTYTRRNVFKKYYFNMFAFYNRRNKPISNSVWLSGINQTIQPIYINSPDDNVMLRGSFTKNIKNIDLVFDTRINYMKYTQSINEVLSSVNQNNTTFGMKVKTNNVNWPLITIGYEKGYNAFKSSSNTEYQSNSFSADIEMELHKNLILKADYDYTNNFVGKNKNYFQIANLYLEYAKENNPWLFSLGFTNLFDANAINSNSISDYVSTYNTVQILPRIAMLTVTYKF